MRQIISSFSRILPQVRMASTTSIPKTARAVIQEDWNSHKLTVTELAVPVPAPNSDEHLIKVHATAPCAGELDWFNTFKDFFAGKPKLGVPCYDLAGTVVAAPAGSKFQPGSEIWTRTTAERTGNARDYTIAITSELALKPKNLSWEETASVPLSAITAYECLFTQGGLATPWKDPAGAAINAQKRLIITSGAGGVGVWLVQLAKAAGVKDIIAIAGTKNVDFVVELGATEVINYQTSSLGKWAAAGNEKADIIVDLMGGQTLKDAWSAVKEGGTLLSIREPPETQKPDTEVAKDIKNFFFIMTPEGWILEEVAKLIEEGKGKAIVDSVYPLEEAQKAFDIVEGGHARGKVILKL
jgi:NADPH:quinone reductase-like Zn-dependent oxidoreductase